MTNPDWTTADAIAGTGLDDDQLHAAIHDLHRVRLFRPSPHAGRAWDAVGPECALIDLLAEGEARRRREQVAVARVREELLGLQSLYADAWRTPSPRQLIDEVYGSDGAVATVVAQHLHQGPAEVQVANPRGDIGWLSWLYAVGGGTPNEQPAHSTRLLLDHPARRDRQLRRHLQLLHDHGTEVRTTESAPPSMILISGRAAILPMPPDPEHAPGDRQVRENGTTLVRHPSVVCALSATFDLAWASARPFPDDLSTAGDTVDDPIRRQVLQLMADGHKDEVVARRIGLSVRTCRRYISEIMDELGAASRFQAGVLAQRAVLGNGAGGSFPGPPRTGHGPQ